MHQLLQVLTVRWILGQLCAKYFPHGSPLCCHMLLLGILGYFGQVSNQGVDPVYKVIRLFNWVGYLTLHPHFKIQNISRCISIRITSEKQTMSREPLKLREYTSLTLNSGAPPRGARTSALNQVHRGPPGKISSMAHLYNRLLSRSRSSSSASLRSLKKPRWHPGWCHGT